MQPTLSIITACVLVLASTSYARGQSQQPSTLTPIQQEPATQESASQLPFEKDPQSPQAETDTQARTVTTQTQDGESSIQQVKTKSMIVNFRQPEWQNVHANDWEQAQRTIDTLQGIGIDATASEHDGHVDVRFQCPNWKSMRVDTNQQLIQWQKYLDLIGIDTVALNPPADTSLPTVSFKLPKPRTAHLDDKDHANALVETFEMLGCTVSTNDHNGHVDLNLKCNEWLTIGLTSEDSAHVWQDWLKQNGFETRHTHKN